jgi:hypothetical protein
LFLGFSNNGIEDSSPHGCGGTSWAEYKTVCGGISITFESRHSVIK